MFKTVGIFTLVTFFYILQINAFPSPASSATATKFNCSEPPKLTNFNIYDCCRAPEINLGNVPEQCNKNINSMKSANKNFPPYAHMCYPECIYRETGAMVNGEIQIEVVKRFIQRNVHRRDNDIIPFIVDAFDSCLQNIKGHMNAAGLKSYAKLPQGCTPFATMMYNCVNAETFLHCPTKMWKDDSNCNLARNFAEQCNPLPHVPLPMN